MGDSKFKQMDPEMRGMFFARIAQEKHHNLLVFCTEHHIIQTRMYKNVPDENGKSKMMFVYFFETANRIYAVSTYDYRKNYHFSASNKQITDLTLCSAYHIIGDPDRILRTVYNNIVAGKTIDHKGNVVEGIVSSGDRKFKVNEDTGEAEEQDELER